MLPRAEHRCCARHIYANWKKNHPGNVLKAMFWKAAKSSTVEEFNKIMLRPMKGALYWPHTDLPDILPPKARRMPGRPKKARRQEEGEVGAGGKISKKGIELRCSLCLTPGHNKSTCKASEEEIAEKQSAASEAKKAQTEALKAQATRNVSYFFNTQAAFIRSLYI